MFIIAQIQKIKDDLTRLLGKVKVTDGTNDLTLTDDGKINVIIDSDISKPLWVQEKDNVPTHSSKNNPSYEMTYSNGKITQIDMTIDTTVYRKTLTWDGDDLTQISEWSVVT